MQHKIVHLWSGAALSGLAMSIHPCYMVSRCPVMRCPPLQSGAALSGLAMSTLAIWSRVVQSRDVSPHNFDGLAMSVLAISVAPSHCHSLTDSTTVVLLMLLCWGLSETLETMYPVLQLKHLPAPDLSAFELMNLNGTDYEALKANLSQTIQEAVNEVG